MAQVTTNLEKLAGQVGQVWEDADNADQALEQRIESTAQGLSQRIDDSARGLGQRIEGAERTLDARLSAVEKTVQFNTNTVDHALEKIAAGTDQRAADQGENQRRAAQHEDGIHRLQDSIARLESLLPGPELDDRLDGVERSISGLTDRLEHYDPAQKFDASMQALSHRLEQLEKDHIELVTELRIAAPQEPPPPVHEAPPPVQQTPQTSAPGAFEQPPFAQTPPFAQPPGYEPPDEDFLSQDETVDAFAPPPGFTFDTPPGLTFDTPQEPHEESFTPDFADVFEEPPEEFEEPPEARDNFLARARQSARAASDQAESERRGRLSAFRWSQNGADKEEKAKPRYLLPLLIALLVVVAAAAALVLSQRAKTAAPKPVKSAATAAKGPTFRVPAPSGDTQFVIAPQANSFSIDHAPAGNAPVGDAPIGNAQDFSSQRSEPAASDTSPQAPHRLQHEVSSVPVKPVANSAAAKTAAPASMDRVVQLANSGNPTALTILGLRALDAPNGAANLPDAVKFLTQAAEKGQAVAQYRLGTLYERGQGVAADAAKAMHWYGLAAAQGNRKAMHNLAVAYASGGKKNMAEAARWFAKAASLGLSDSQFNLAVLYERGDGVPQSLVDAYKWYSIAATSSDAESKARIGVLQTQLGDADRAAASKSAATFHAAPLNRSANVPPEPADLGN